MARRIVLLGATGHTGDLVAERLVAAGCRPLLAGRDAERLSASAARLGGLEHAVADARDPAKVGSLLDARTVLISTVGPFSDLGHGVVEAAIGRAAAYLDSTGEPAFIRAVFERHGPRADDAGVLLLSAMGYDYVPGALAGGLALSEAGAAATRVEIGYFVLGARQPTSRGTRRSAASALLEPSFAYRHGALRRVRLADRGRRLQVAGRQRAVVSVGGAEHFGLPPAHGGLTDVEVYAAFFGSASPLVRGASATLAAASRLPAVRGALRAGLQAYASRGGAPAGDAAAESVVVARAYASDGERLSSVELRGPEPYALTAGLLAWAAQECASAPTLATGARGPLGAFGLEALADGGARVGLRRTG